MMTGTTTGSAYAPRGDRRLVYVSDPSSIASRHLPDPVREEDLRRWVDELADAGMHTFIQEAYTQGWTTYWRCDRFDYDARLQHRRFLPLLDAGVQPLQVLLDQSRRRGMEFLAGVRVNDNHGHISVKQGVGAGARFLVDNPHLQIQEAPPGPYYKLSTPLDFTHAEVRDFVFSAVEELARTFDVDGIELCFRDHRYFPPGRGADGQPLMTELVRRVRRMLKGLEPSRGRKLLLGARVYQTLEECHSQGLDVPTWISEGLLDYVAPADVMHADFNAPYEQFARLARQGDCLVYPGVLPWSSVRMRRRLAENPLTPEQLRALAQNFYGAGADGVSFYNHFVPLNWAPSYPMMLFGLDELGDPERVAAGSRHYLFEPTWAGQLGFGEGRTSTGALKSDRITLGRSETSSSGSYLLRVYEDISKARMATLLFRAYNMTGADEVRISLNGSPVPDADIRRRDDEPRIDMAAPTDPSSNTRMGLPPVAEAPSSPTTFWFPLAAPPFRCGENELEVTLTRSDPSGTDDVEIDEIEVFVAP